MADSLSDLTREELVKGSLEVLLHHRMPISTTFKLSCAICGDKIECEREPEVCFPLANKPGDIEPFFNKE